MPHRIRNEIKRAKINVLCRGEEARLEEGDTVAVVVVVLLVPSEEKKIAVESIAPLSLIGAWKTYRWALIVSSISLLRWIPLALRRITATVARLTPPPKKEVGKCQQRVMNNTPPYILLHALREVYIRQQEQQQLAEECSAKKPRLSVLAMQLGSGRIS